MLYTYTVTRLIAFIALTLLGISKIIWPVNKNWMITCWHGQLSGMRWKWFAYGPAVPLPPYTLVASQTSSMILPFQGWLSQVVPENRTWNGCFVVHLCFFGLIALYIMQIMHVCKCDMQIWCLSVEMSARGIHLLTFRPRDIIFEYRIYRRAYVLSYDHLHKVKR